MEAWASGSSAKATVSTGPEEASTDLEMVSVQRGALESGAEACS